MSVQFTEEGIKRLPEPIVNKLRALIKRIRLVTFLKGTFAAAAWTLGAVLIRSCNSGCRFSTRRAIPRLNCWPVTIPMK